MVYVLDAQVMVSTSGHRLLEEDAVATLKVHTPRQDPGHSHGAHRVIKPHVAQSKPKEPTLHGSLIFV